ncbi:MAG: hypothetical protein EXQ61_07115 [Ilumatobacteraceae bacterium]|nr:hypothetical protein [Ilumatobacteraceae bacterium]
MAESPTGKAGHMAVLSPLRPARIVVSVVLLAWVVLALSSPWQTIADDASRPVAWVVITWGWFLWTIVGASLLVPSPMSLTIVRIVVPSAVVVSVVASQPLAVFCSVVALIVYASPVFVDTMVQGGAYGNETRFALRTPLPYVIPAVITWMLYATSLIGGSLLLAAHQYIFGAVLVAIGILLSRTIPQRLHRLARRWLVLVPVGIVVHDHLVLHETIMATTGKIQSITRTAEIGEAADLTGGILGDRLIITLAEADKVVLSAITAKTLGTTEALHVKMFCIAPRRLAAALSAITR